MNATNLSVVAFATAQSGNKVKRGECWDLAEEALRYAGAKTSNDIMGSSKVTANADYVWGTPIGVTSVEPGDIIQLRDYDYRTSRADGSWSTLGKRPHHTVIVAGVYPVTGAKAVLVYEQNAPKGSPVGLSTYFLNSGTGLTPGDSVTIMGRLWVYRPIKK